MLSLGMLLKSASIVQVINTAAKPAPKDRAGVLPINSAGRKAAMAITHQGKKKPLAKVNIRMMKNSMVVSILMMFRHAELVSAPHMQSVRPACGNVL